MDLYDIDNKTSRTVVNKTAPPVHKHTYEDITDFTQGIDYIVNNTCDDGETKKDYYKNMYPENSIILTKSKTSPIDDMFGDCVAAYYYNNIYNDVSNIVNAYISIKPIKNIDKIIVNGTPITIPQNIKYTYTYINNNKQIVLSEQSGIDILQLSNNNILEIISAPITSNSLIFRAYNGTISDNHIIIDNYNYDLLNNTVKYIGTETVVNNSPMLNTIVKTNDNTYSLKQFSLNNTFAYNKIITEVDFSSCYTYGVTSMQNTFEGCDALTSIDLTGVDINIEESDGMKNFINSPGVKIICSKYTYDKLKYNHVLSGNNWYYNGNYAEVLKSNYTIIIDIIDRNNETQTLSSNDITISIDSNISNGKIILSLENVEKILNNTQGITCLEDKSYSIDGTNVTFRATAADLTSTAGSTDDKIGYYTYNYGTNGSSKSISYTTPGADTINDVSAFTPILNFYKKNDELKVVYYSFTNLDNLFTGNNVLTNNNKPDFLKWDTTNVTTANNMFNGCSNLTSLNIKNIFTEKLTNFSNMFNGCSDLTILDISQFTSTHNSSDTEINFSRMFNGCTNLQTLYINSITIDTNDTKDNILTNCNSLTTIYCNKETADTLQQLLNTEGSTDWVYNDISGILYKQTSILYVSIITNNFEEKTEAATKIKFTDIDNIDEGYIISADQAKEILTDTNLSKYNIKFIESIIRKNGDKLIVRAGTVDITQSNTILGYYSYSFNNNSILCVSDNLNDEEQNTPFLEIYTLNDTFAVNKQITNLSNVFINTPLFADIKFPKWYVEKVENVSNMFANCVDMFTLDISTWNFNENVMSANMFLNCNTLVRIKCSKTLYNSLIYSKALNKDKDTWYYNNNICGRMYNVKLYNIIGNYKSINIINYNTFDTCEIADDKIEHFKIYLNDTDINNIYYNIVSEINTIEYGSFYINNETDTIGFRCGAFETIYNGIIGYYNYDILNTTINIGDNTSNIDNNEDLMKLIPFLNFYYKSGSKNQQVIITDISGLFANNLLSGHINLNAIDTKDVENMSNLFSKATNIKSLSIDKWNVKNVKNIEGMFNYSGITGNVDLHNWNINLQNSDTDNSNTISMLNLFCDCYDITNIDIHNWDVSGVTNIQGMFARCYNLLSINMLGLTFEKASNIDYMFQGDGCLHTIKCSNETYNKVKAELPNGESQWEYNNELQEIYINEPLFVSLIYYEEVVQTNNTPEVIPIPDKINEDNIIKTNCYITKGINNRYYVDTGVYSAIKYIAGKSIEKYMSEDNNVFILEDVSWCTTNDEKYAIVRFTTKDIRKSGTILGYYTYNVSSAEKNTISLIYNAPTSGDIDYNQLIPMLNFICTDDNNKGIKLYKAIDLAQLFNNKLSGDVDLLKFDVRNVTNMTQIFTNCQNVTSINISDWYTNNVKSMLNMFANCTKLTTITVGDNFNTSAVTNMQGMFYKCETIPSINNIITKFDTKAVTNMQGIFNGCKNLETITFGENFSTNNVTDMNNMFNGCEKLTTITYPNTFDLSKCENVSNMFNGCAKLSSIDLSKFTTSTTLQNMSSMFSGCSGLTSITFGNNFNTSQVTTMGIMFLNCSGLKSLDLSNFNTSLVTNMSGMFNGCSGLTSITFGNNFNTSQVKYMNSMFEDCSGLKSLDLSNFTTSTALQNMSGMFSGCTKLTTITVSDNFVVNTVTNINSMFKGCVTIEKIEFMSKIYTNNVTDMDNLFENCSKLTTVTFSGKNFIVNKTYENMFSGCTKGVLNLLNDLTQEAFDNIKNSLPLDLGYSWVWENNNATYKQQSTG